jgi:hypothetical protein
MGDHLNSAADLTAIRRDLEALDLGCAVSAHAEHRVLRSDTRTWSSGELPPLERRAQSALSNRQVRKAR